MRTLLGITAIAVLMLMPLGVHQAKAVVQYCDLAPENCFYGGDGRWYYIAPGSRLHKAYRAGKITLPDIVERDRQQRACALHATEESCRSKPVLRKKHRR
jgi:hypothetical protein